jgi:hypothetical protein
VGRAWSRALYTRSSPFYVGHGRTVAESKLEGAAWCRLDDELLAWRRALYTRSTIFYVGVRRTSGARRRRSGGGPGGGCVRRPVGIYLYLHAVGPGNPVAVPGLARKGAERGTNWGLDDVQLQFAGSVVVGKPCTEGFGKA